MRVFVECPACEDQVAIEPCQMQSQMECESCGRAFTATAVVPAPTTEPRGAVPPATTGAKPPSIAADVTDSFVPSAVKEAAGELAADAAPVVDLVSAETDSPREGPTRSTNQLGIEDELAVPCSPDDAWPLPPELPQQPGLAKRIGSRRRSKLALIMPLLMLVGLAATLAVLFITLEFVAPDEAETAAQNANFKGDSDQAGQSLEPFDSPKPETIQNRSSGGAPEQDSPNSSMPTDQNRELAATDIAADQRAGGDSPAGRDDQVTQPQPAEYPSTFSMREWERLWQKLNTYSVRLEVTTAKGVHVSSGVIVDSRGWIATSYATIRGATAIEATLAARAFDTGAPRRDQSGSVLGVVATEPQLDLAIVAVDRDLVINLTEVGMADADRIVRAERLIVARTPPAGRRLWFSESRVADRVTFEQLNDSMKQRLQAQPLNRAKSCSWIQHGIANATHRDPAPSQTPPLSTHAWGAPLYSAEGKLVAINSSLHDHESAISYAVPVGELQQLMTAAEGSPLVSLGKVAIPNNDQNSLLDSLADEEPIATVPGINSQFPEIMELSEALRQCARFGMIASNQEQADQLREFTILLQSAADLSVDIGTSDRDRATLKRELGTLLQQMDDVLRKSSIDKADDIDGMNRWMLTDSVNRSVPVAIAATVDENAATSPIYDGQPTAFFQALGQDSHFFSFVNEQSPVFSQGDRVLIFATLDATFSWRRDGKEVRKLDLIHVAPIDGRR